MKKVIDNIALITTIFIVYAPPFTLVWVIISFILYLIKDLPFAWWSIPAYIVFKFIKTFIFLSARMEHHPHKSKLSERIEALKIKNNSELPE